MFKITGQIDTYHIGSQFQSKQDLSKINILSRNMKCKSYSGNFQKRKETNKEAKDFMCANCPQEIKVKPYAYHVILWTPFGSHIMSANSKR